MMDEVITVISEIDKKLIESDFDIETIQDIFLNLYKKYSLCPKTDGRSTADFDDLVEIEHSKSQALFKPDITLFIKYEHFYGSYPGGGHKEVIELERATKKAISTHQGFVRQRYLKVKDLFDKINEIGLSDDELWLGEDEIKEKFQIDYKLLTKYGFKRFQRDALKVLSLNKSKYPLDSQDSNKILFSNIVKPEDYDIYRGRHIFCHIANKEDLDSFRIILDYILRSVEKKIKYPNLV